VIDVEEALAAIRELRSDDWRDRIFAYLPCVQCGYVRRVQVQADSSGLHYEERCAACQAASRLLICQRNLERAQAKHDEALARQWRTLKKRKVSGWTPPAPRLAMKHAEGRYEIVDSSGEIVEALDYGTTGRRYSLCGQRIGQSYEGSEVTCPKCLKKLSEK